MLKNLIGQQFFASKFIARQTASTLTIRNVGLRSIHSTSTQLTWGGGKLKSHSGAGKRFFPVGKRKVIDPKHSFAQQYASLDIPGILDLTNKLKPSPTSMKTIGVMYKRGQTGKQHLNSKMRPSRRMRLRGTVVEEKGSKVKILSRLIGNRK